jgi:hypothetical protein
MHYASLMKMVELLCHHVFCDIMMLLSAQHVDVLLLLLLLAHAKAHRQLNVSMATFHCCQLIIPADAHPR